MWVIGGILLLGIALLILFGGMGENESKEPESAGTSGPTQFVPSAANPTLTGGAKGSWNEMPGDPVVIKDNNRYKMWYGAHNSVKSRTQIGYAESQDGVSWQLHQVPVLENGPSGSYDAAIAETPFVVKVEDRYEIWYSAKRTEFEDDSSVYQIAHATSLDGIRWTKDPKNPVIQSGDLYGWHGLGVMEPTILKRGDTYQMWFMGMGIDPKDQKTIHFWVGYATSPNGSAWTVRSEPLFELGAIAGGTKDLAPNSAFYVLHNGQRYEFWYIGGGVPDLYATSHDGIRWEKQADISIVPKGASGSWNEIVSAPSIIIENQIYQMWYSGVTADQQGFRAAIGYATSSGR